MSDLFTQQGTMPELFKTGEDIAEELKSQTVEPNTATDLLLNGSSSSFSVSSTLPRTNSLSCPLITSSFSCTIFSDMVYRLLSEWCVVTSFYQSSANHVYFYAFFFLRNLLYLIPVLREKGHPWVTFFDRLKEALKIK